VKKLTLAGLVLSLIALPAFGASVTVTGPGQSFSLDYDGSIDIGGVPTVMPGLSAQIRFTVSDIYYVAAYNTTIVEMSLVVENTSDASIWQNAAVTGIGFNTNPNVRRVGSGAAGAYNYVVLNSTLPTNAGFMVEVCVSGRANQCSGPGTGATQIGQTTSTTLQLAFGGDITALPLTLDNFGIRWQRLLSSQYGVVDEAGVGVGVLTPPIPEPAAAAVFGVGSLAIAVAMRRRRAN
jgi:hypothetical protein